MKQIECLAIPCQVQCHGHLCGDAVTQNINASATENTHETRSKYLTNDSITEKMKFYSHEAVEVSRLKCHPNGYGYGILFNMVEPLARGGGATILGVHRTPMVGYTHQSLVCIAYWGDNYVC